MLKKYIYTFFAINCFFSSTYAQEACSIYYTPCEISEMIYQEYIDSTMMLSDCIFEKEAIFFQGYSQACLNLFMRINMIED